MITRTSSFIKESVLQLDGTISMTVEHTFDDGRVLTETFFVDPEKADPDQVVTLQGARIERELQRREEAERIAYNFEIPLTKNEFLDRLTITERITIRAMAKDTSGATVEIESGVTVPRQGLIEDLMDYINGAKNGIYRSNPKTIKALQLLVLIGALSAERPAEILK